MKKILSLLVSLGLGALSMTGCANTGISYQYEDAARYTRGGASLAQTIEEIEIDWISGAVTVDYHDEATVIFSETSADELTEDTSLYYRVHGKTLEIRYMRSGATTESTLKKELTVFIPRGTGLRALSLNSVSAELTVGALSLTHFEAESVSGTIDASLDEVSEISVQTVSGNAEVSFARADTLKAESVSGNILAKAYTEAPRRVDAETVSGSVTLRIPEKTGFTLEYETVSGNLYCDFPFEKKGKLYLVGGGARAYDAETVSGNLNILYLSEEE
ncbi:MAG: DUF4097 family beta strand repeat protein [Clostridia bacterium]|nr:DUF4097 family beta strand repeat protein [Clostridia bacterium]